jgi:hypothetical protein
MAAPTASVVAAASPAIELMKASDATTSHPKILITDQGFTDLKARLTTDSTLNSWLPSLIYRADKMVAAPVLSYKLTGTRLLSVSEEALDRSYTLAFAWKVTGDSKYAARLWQELNAISTFTDWNPSHFLDTAEMAHALAIGYDWLYSYLTPAQRTQLVDAVENKAFRPALSQIADNAFWASTRTNWNLVSNGGIGIAALAFSDTAPSSNAILGAVSKQIGNGLAAYSPDGAYEEGVSYWGYATGYLATFTAALQSATGRTYGILDAPGLAATGDFATRMVGSSGLAFSFGDAAADAKLTMPLLGLSQLYSNPSLVSTAVRGREDTRDEISARTMIWYRPPGSAVQVQNNARPLDSTFSAVNVAALRSSWGDSNAVTAALRAGGQDLSSHANLDAGDFVLDALGENWAVETGGTDQYDLPGYLDSAAGGSRWNYYRNRPEGQNTVVANPGLAAGASLTAGGTVSLKQSEPDTGSAVADLDGVYPGVQSWSRGVKLFDSRQRVLVQDEMSSPTVIDAWWFMHTRADVSVAADGRSATLTQNGKQMLARITSPAGASFLHMAATPLATSPAPAGQSTNAGIRKLAIRLQGATAYTVAVEFVPLTGVSAPEPAPIVPLGAWAPSGQSAATLSGISVDGVAIGSFSPGALNYSRGAAFGDAVPQVTASVPSGATATVIQAKSVPGVATIDVAQSGLATTRYRVNLLVGPIPPKTVTATTSTSTVANLVDGDIQTQWQSVVGEQSAVFDYGRGITFTTLRMFWAAVPAKGAYYDVLGSSDGSTWRSLVVASNWVSNQTRVVTLPSPASSYRFLKLVVRGDKTSDLRTTLTEFQAFGRDPNSGSAPVVTPHASMAITSTWSGMQSKAQQTLTYRVSNAQGVVVTVPSSAMTFQSSDPTIASVSATGVVTGGRGGTARVTASTLMGQDLVSAAQVVTVSDPLAKTVQVASDSYVIGGSSSGQNYNSQNYMQILSKPQYAEFERRAFLGFDLTGIDPAQVESARLVFTSWIAAAESPPATVTAYAVNASWSESTLTFTNQPSMEYRVGSTVVDSIESSRQMDVTDFIRQRSGTSVSFGLREDNPPGGFGPQMFVRGKGSNAPPRLEIRLRDSGDPVTAPISITSALTNELEKGTVTGTLRGPASTNVLVDLGVSSRAQCPPVLADAAALPPILVQTDSAGNATFTAQPDLKVGQFVVGTATIGSARSVVSACKTVVQDPNAMAKKIVSPQADTFVQGGYASTTNFGTANTLQILSKPAYADFEQTAFIGYALAGIDRSRIQSATLVFTGAVQAANTSATVGGYAIGGVWSESTLTFKTQPSPEYRVGTTSIDSTMGERRMDVTDYIRARAGSNATVALRQENPPGGIGPQIFIKSRESTSPPFLDIRLRPTALVNPSAPQITSVVSDSTHSGKISGTVTSQPSTDVVVEIGVTSKSTCPTAMAESTPVNTQTVRTNSSGVASFSAAGSFAVGAKVLAVATAGPDRSMVSGCATAVQNPSTPSYVRIPVAADAHVVGGNGSSTNYGSLTYMNVLAKPAYPTFEQRAFLAFSLSGISAANVQSAKLVFTSGVGTANTNATLTGYSVSQTWSESGLTFANQPAMQAKIGTMDISSTEAAHSMDVTDYVRLRAGNTASIGIRQDDPPGGIGPSILIRSRESAVPGYIEITLRAQTASATAAPTIDLAVSTASNAGRVTGEVAGAPGEALTVDVGVTSRSPCQPVMSDTAPVASIATTADESGVASFAASGSFPVGASIVAVATTSEGIRSPVSTCTSTVQDPGAPSLTTLVSSADAHVVGGNGSTLNYGSQPLLQVLSKPAYASFEQTAFLRFDPSAIDSSLVDSATLSLNGWIGTAGMKGTLAAYDASGSWSETGLTFNNQPSLSSRVGTATITSAESSLRLDLTDYLRAEHDGMITIALRQDDPPNGVGPSISLRSRESATPPKIDIVLRPSGTAPSAAPAITWATSSVSENGIVRGTVSGTADATVTVDVGATKKPGCAPAFVDSRLLSSSEVTLDANGNGSFEVTGKIAIGERVVAVARVGETRSPLSNCGTVSQDPSVPAILRVPVSTDAHVIGGNGKTTNYGTSTYLNVLSKPAYAEFEYRAFMAFSLAGIDPAEVQSAKLIFRSGSGSTTQATLSAYATSGDWGETSITFAKQPTMLYKVGSSAVDATEAQREMDVTDYVRQRAGDIASFGFRQDDPPGGIGPTFLIRSKESTSPEYIEVTLKAQTAEALAAPIIESAFSTAENEGTVSGSVSGPPSTEITVELGVSRRQECQPVMSDSAPLASVTVTTDADGAAAFAASGEFPVGSSVVATATSGDAVRSPVSACSRVVQDPSAAERWTQVPSADAHVVGGNGSQQNYGGSALLQVLSKPAYAAFEQTSFLRFDATGLDPERVQSAKLTLSAWMSVAGEGTLAAYATSGQWTEGDLTFATQPVPSYRVGTATVRGQESTIEIDLTDYLRAGNDGQVQIVLRQDDPAGGIGPVIYIRSRESAVPPRLDVVMASATSIPPSPPVITGATSTNDGVATVTGTVDGAGGSTLTVAIGATGKTDCAPAFADAELAGTADVVLDADGHGAFTVQAQVPVGQRIIAVAQGSARSPLSECHLITLDPGVSPVIRFPASADAHVVGGGASGTNYGSSTFMNILSKPAHAAYEQRLFMAFPLTGIASEDVISARLVFTSTIGTAGAEAILTGYSVSEPWAESALTFTNQPSMTSVIGSVMVGSTETSHEIDVSDFVRQNAGSSASIGLRQDDPPGGFGPSILVRSRESASPEYLEVTLKPGAKY